MWVNKLSLPGGGIIIIITYLFIYLFISHLLILQKERNPARPLPPLGPGADQYARFLEDRYYEC